MGHGRRRLGINSVFIFRLSLSAVRLSIWVWLIQIRRPGPLSVLCGGTIWFPGRMAAWLWVRRGRRDRVLKLARLPRGCSRFWQRLCGFAPGLAQAEVREIRVGLRPYTEDHLPVLGHVPSIRNIYLATGHGPTGLQLGPYSGKLIADLVLEKGLATEIDAYQITAICMTHRRRHGRPHSQRGTRDARCFKTGIVVRWVCVWFADRQIR